MTRIPYSLIKHIQHSVDITSVISRYVNLKKEGQYYFGHCPWHRDTRPSFSVTPSRQIFKCFSCGRGGNVFRFLSLYHHITYAKAIQEVAKYSDIKIPQKYSFQSAPAYHPQVSRPMLEMMKLYRLAAKQAHFILTNTNTGARGLAYLHNRGIQDRVIKNHLLGYEPDDNLFLKIIRGRHIDPTIINESKLLKYTYHHQITNRFANRVVFPIYNAHRQIIALSGRSLEHNNTRVPKYLNSPDTMIFHRTNSLYNINHAIQAEHRWHFIILYEGFMDVLSSCQAGMNNCVSSLGTSVTINQIRLLSRYTHNVCICYDGDAPGQQGILRAINIIYHHSYMRISVVRMPKDTDPDEFRKYYGESALKSYLLKRRISATDFILAYLQEQGKFDFHDPQDVYKYVSRVLKYIARIRNNIARKAYLNRLAKRFSLSTSELESQIKSLRYHHWRSYRRRQNNSASALASPSVSRADKAEQWLVHFAIHSPKYLQYIESYHVQFSSDYLEMLKASEIYWSQHAKLVPKLYLRLLPSHRIQNIARHVIRLSTRPVLSKHDLAYCQQIIQYHNQEHRIRAKLVLNEQSHQSSAQKKHNRLKQYMAYYRLLQKKNRLSGYEKK